MEALVAATRQGAGGCRRFGRRRGGDRHRHHRLERDPGGRAAAAARRLLSLVRPPRVGRGRADHRDRPRARPGGHQWCGGVYSSEWGWAKLLHWLRHNPGKRDRMVTALEHCDMVAAVLCGITDPAQVPRSICAMGHKWMWNRQLGGLPPEEFLTAVDPLLDGVRDKLGGTYATSDHIAGRSRPNGRRSSDCAPASRFPPARSTRIGTPSARAAASATSSTWSAPPPASWRSRTSRR